MELVPKLNLVWPRQGSPETIPKLPVISFCPQSGDRALIWWGSHITENLSVTVGFPLSPDPNVRTVTNFCVGFPQIH